MACVVLRGKKGDSVIDANGKLSSGVKLAIAMLAGFALLNMWTDVVSHGIAFARQAYAIEDALGINPRFFFSCSLVLLCLVAVSFPDRLQKVDRICLPLFSSAGAVGTLLYACSLFVDDGLVPCAVVGALLIGVAYGWLEVKLFLLVSRLNSFAEAVWLLAGSFLARVYLSNAANGLGNSCQMALCAVAPLAVGLCIVLIARFMGRTSECVAFAASGADTDGVTRLAPNMGTSDTVAMVALIVLDSFLTAIVRSLSSLGSWGSSSSVGTMSFGAFLVTAVVFLLLVRCTFLSGSEKSVVSIAIPALLVLLSGMVALAFVYMAGDRPDDFYVLLLADEVEMYGHMLSWVVIVAVIRETHLHPYRVKGLAEGVYSLVAMALAAFRGVGLLSGIEGIVLVFAIYIATIVAFLLFWRSRSGHVEEKPQSLNSACSLVAEHYELTGREAEVLALIAQGRSRAFVQEELFLSENTVKSHVYHIYQKLGVHSKQELITLVQSFNEK